MNPSADRATSIILPLASGARQTYKTAVFKALYELIQNLDLPPGERLVEADLAARFGVSKTPIREALLLLEKEGLVTSAPHVGATVTWLSLADYEQKLFILDALEQPALGLVVERITPLELEACSRLLKGITAAHRGRDEPDYLRQVMRLHSDLFAAARYPQLTEMINGVQRSLRRYTEAFVHQFSENWDRELRIVTARFTNLCQMNAEAAAAAVQQGHAELLEFARQRVNAKDPLVMPYVLTLDAEDYLQRTPVPLVKHDGENR
jgi:DNA-binding GntR family transcriptional regulator